MAIMRAKLQWTIPNAGVSYSVLHFLAAGGFEPTQADADNVRTKMGTMKSNIRNLIPGTISLQVMSDIEVIDTPTGNLLSAFSTSADTIVGGSLPSSEKWAAPVGAVITWTTGVVRNSRRVRGRTFLVPISSSLFDVDGTLNPTNKSQIETVATGLRAATPDVPLVVYSRPSAPGATDGAMAEVSGHKIPDAAAILTSRRS